MENLRYSLLFCFIWQTFFVLNLRFEHLVYRNPTALLITLHVQSAQSTLVSALTGNMAASREQKQWRGLQEVNQRRQTCSQSDVSKAYSVKHKEKLFHQTRHQDGKLKAII